MDCNKLEYNNSAGKTVRVPVRLVAWSEFMLSAMEMIAYRLYSPKTRLTFLNLPVLFLFAHAAGMIRLRITVF